jgi:hypothetical protein
MLDSGRADHRFNPDAGRGCDTQDTVRLVRHGVRKLLDSVAAVNEPAAGTLDRALEFDYARPNDKRWRPSVRVKARAQLPLVRGC